MYHLFNVLFDDSTKEEKLFIYHVHMRTHFYINKQINVCEIYWLKK